MTDHIIEPLSLTRLEIADDPLMVSGRLTATLLVIFLTILLVAGDEVMPESKGYAITTRYCWMECLRRTWAPSNSSRTN
jgi:hypothetical protein